MSGIMRLFSRNRRDERSAREKMLRQCSMNGDGKNVHCELCGDLLTAETIKKWDEDGNAYCRHHTGEHQC